MSIELVILRFLHVLLGAFWAGTLIFTAIFLVPALGEAGPDGAKVMAGLTRRRFMDVMPVVALITIVSGLWLYWKVSGGFDHHWIHTPTGLGYGVGGLIAIVAFGIGIGVMRPAMQKIGRLGAGAAQEADPGKRESMMGQVAGLRRRSAAAGRLVAALLALATTLMGIARYL
jgi:uncharacterized membrane protein